MLVADRAGYSDPLIYEVVALASVGTGQTAAGGDPVVMPSNTQSVPVPIAQTAAADASPAAASRIDTSSAPLATTTPSGAGRLAPPVAQVGPARGPVTSAQPVAASAGTLYLFAVGISRYERADYRLGLL